MSKIPDNLVDKLLKITDTYDKCYKTEKLETTHLRYWKIIYNAYDKSQNRVNNIIKQIEKQINIQKKFDKKYQIRSKDEFNIIENYCKQNDIPYEFLIDKNTYTNKVVRISQYIYTNELDCEPFLKFQKKKVPIMYIRIVYNPNLIQKKPDIYDID